MEAKRQRGSHDGLAGGSWSTPNKKLTWMWKKTTGSALVVFKWIVVQEKKVDPAVNKGKTQWIRAQKRALGENLTARCGCRVINIDPEAFLKISKNDQRTKTP
jgi:hypothetical protein